MSRAVRTDRCRWGSQSCVAPAAHPIDPQWQQHQIITTADARTQVRARDRPCRVSVRPPDRPDEAVLFLGDDQAGLPLEVVGVELSDGTLRVIHAMPLRAGYRDLYEEATKWRL